MYGNVINSGGVFAYCIVCISSVAGSSWRIGDYVSVARNGSVAWLMCISSAAMFGNGNVCGVKALNVAWLCRKWRQNMQPVCVCDCVKQLMCRYQQPGSA